MAVPVAAAAKKVAAALATDKKGRKIIGYVIGIAVFILCIPIICVYCFFGWMAGTGELDVGQSSALAIYEALQDPEIQEATNRIETEFLELELPEKDIQKAQMIFIVYLTGREQENHFYTKLAGCFTETTEKKTVYLLVNHTFNVTITEADMEWFDQLYGITPARKHEPKKEESNETADDQSEVQPGQSEGSVSLP